VVRPTQALRDEVTQRTLRKDKAAAWQIMYRCPIEIDGLPIIKMGGFSMAMLNSQMVHPLVS
jgi:hypothetical protein